MSLLRLYATAWEGQIGRLWYGVNRPRFWLYAATRKGYGRTWLFWWPGFIRWTDKQGNAR